MKFQRFSFSLLLQLKSGTKRDKSSVEADVWVFIYAKYCSFAHYPSDFVAVAFALYIVCARDGR